MANKLEKQAWLKDIKVLVWDLDGTLYQSRPEINKIYQDEIYQTVAGSLKLSLKRAKEVFQNRQKKEKGLTKTLNSLGINGYTFIKQINKQIVSSDFLRRDKKLIILFKQLANWKHILLTDNSYDDGVRKLIALGLNKNVFAKMFFGIDLKVTKPNIFLFKKVLASFSYPAGSFLMIGDNEEKDIVPAKEADMKTCLVWGKSKIADISLETVYDIKKLFVDF